MLNALERFCDRLRITTGISVSARDAFSTQARFAPLLRRTGDADLEGFLQRIEKTNDAGLTRAAIEVMTTSETFFFRDRAYYDAFLNVALPTLMAARAQQRRLRIWCAACATGQEPYSIAMLLDEQARALAGWRVDLLATDLSHSALDQAQSGEYNQFEVQRGLPVHMLLRHFSRVGERWRLSEQLRARIDFRQLNLMSDFSALGRFDIIFCRNVLMYFDVSVKLDVLSRLANASNDDGYLLLGAAETLVGLNQDWRLASDHAPFHVRADRSALAAAVGEAPAAIPA